MAATFDDALLDVLRQALDEPDAMVADARRWVALLRDPARLGVEFEEPDSPADRAHFETCADLGEQIADAIARMSRDELREEIARRERWLESAS